MSMSLTNDTLDVKLCLLFLLSIFNGKGRGGGLSKHEISLEWNVNDFKTILEYLH